MRVVIAPFNRMNDVTLAGVWAAGHDVLCTGDEVLSYAEIAAQYPEGWVPDVFIFWSPEYHPVPVGLESAACLKVGVFGDWNLGGQAAQQVAGVFDLLFADINGADRLRALGFQNVVSAPLWSFDPELHRRLPNIERDIDIVLVGNFNHEIQQERARWLARVARLSSRYSVLVTSGITGEAYTEVLNRAKIVFNRSIRGEINMRAYEAAACGALLFYERQNREISSLYMDRQECVLYGDEDLEPLLDHYLTHAVERQSIAENGFQRVQRETPSSHLVDMFSIIARKLAEHSPDSITPFASFSDADREVHLARQWLLSSDVRCLGAAEMTLQRAEQVGASPPLIARLRGYLFAQAGMYLPGIDKNAAWAGALNQWRRAVALEPESHAGRLNLASLLLETGLQEEAGRHLMIVHDALSRPHPIISPGELYWPCRFTAFGVQYDRIEIIFARGSAAWHGAMRSLLLWRTSELLSDLTFAEGQYLESERYAAEACKAVPEMAPTYFRHGRALHALGRVQDAVHAYKVALEINPFLTEARGALAQLLIDIERPADAIAILDDWTAIIAGSPPYRSHLPECERLRSAAKQAAALEPRPVNGLRRWLAFPDWTCARQWQALIEAFVSRMEVGPALLMLWVDQRAGLEPALLLNQIANYLTTVLRLPPAEFPNITIVAHPLKRQDRWKLFQAADAILAAGPIPSEFKDVFEASGLPVLSTAGMTLPAA